MRVVCVVIKPPASCQFFADMSGGTPLLALGVFFQKSCPNDSQSRKTVAKEGWVKTRQVFDEQQEMLRCCTNLTLATPKQCMFSTD
jgi:hypothetical protein